MSTKLNDLCENLEGCKVRTADNNDVSVCANCGKGEKEGCKLKSCTACKMVKYCNRECQIAHRPQHKKECRRRTVELHDDDLFKQPPPEHEDCPICFLRLPYLASGRMYMACCGNMICSGCVHAPLYDNQGNEVANKKCLFCRTPPTYLSREEIVKAMNKRMESGDAQATFNVGCYYRDGTSGYPQDYKKALELWHRARELGFAGAYNSIGYAYNNGEGVEVDKKKGVYYYELSAMGGSVAARFNLGILEEMASNWKRAVRHLMIAVAGGHPNSLQRIQGLYKDGHVTKEDYTKALRLYQYYLGEIKSKQRDNAAAFNEKYRYY